MTDDLTVLLAQLRHGDCRFIVNDVRGPDQTRYCGVPAATGSSWCPKHRQVCVTAMAPRMSLPVRP